jgi:hypothetical protein
MVSSGVKYANRDFAGSAASKSGPYVSCSIVKEAVRAAPVLARTHGSFSLVVMPLGTSHVPPAIERTGDRRTMIAASTAFETI